MCWFIDRTILDGSGIATVSRPAVRFSCGTPAPCAERLRNLLIRISTSLYCNRWGKIVVSLLPEPHSPMEARPALFQPSLTPFQSYFLPHGARKHAGPSPARKTVVLHMGSRRVQPERRNLSPPQPVILLLPRHAASGRGTARSWGNHWFLSYTFSFQNAITLFPYCIKNP